MRVDKFLIYYNKWKMKYNFVSNLFFINFSVHFVANDADANDSNAIKVSCEIIVNAF